MSPFCLFPLNLSGRRTEEIFGQTVSSHLSELSQGDLDTRGGGVTTHGGPHQDNGVAALCVCV